jgi:NADPH2:quinone reductase
MKAIRVHACGGPEVLHLEEVAAPVPAGGQVLVRIRAVGVNPVDTYIRAALHGRKPDLPYTPGSDAAGTIEAMGAGVSGWAVGDRVYLSGTASGGYAGAYAEQAICSTAQVHRLPANVTFQQGAAMNVPYATAWRALFDRASARPGESVLVHGGSGGVGTAAIQMARAHGMTVLATAGTARGLELVVREGAHHAFNHAAPGYVDAIGQATGGQGVDVVLEMLANVNLDADLGLLAPRGRVVVIGNRGRVEIDARQIMGRDGAILGMALLNASPQELARVHAGLIAGLESGTLRPIIGREFALGDAARAHEAVLQPGAYGKIVLVP